MLYVGSSKHLNTRLREHLQGKVLSTKNRRPLTLVGWREFDTIQEAAIWEKKYKNSHGQIERDLKSGTILTYSRS